MPEGTLILRFGITKITNIVYFLPISARNKIVVVYFDEITCLTAQDNYKAVLDYFKIKY